MIRVGSGVAWVCMSIRVHIFSDRVNKEGNKKLCYRAVSVKSLSAVETNCTTNPQQIAVMQSDGYSVASRDSNINRVCPSARSLLCFYSNFCNT